MSKGNLILVIKLISTIVSSLPGAAVTFGAFTFPKNIQILVGSVATAATFILVLLLLTRWQRIRELTHSSLTKWVVGGFLLFLVSAVLFFTVYKRTVIVPTDPAFDPDPIFFPLWLTGSVGERVENTGGRQAFVNEFGPGTAKDRLDRMDNSWFAFAITVLSLLALIVLGGLSLSSSITIPLLYLCPPDDEAISLPSQTGVQDDEVKSLPPVESVEDRISPETNPDPQQSSHDSTD